MPQDEAEDSEAVDDESGSSSGETSPCMTPAASPKSFEKISPVKDTPWGEFASCVGKLLMWPAAFVLLQMVWSMKMRPHIDLAFFPVSLLLVPFAFCWLRGKRHVGIRNIQGLEYLLYWMCSRNPVLGRIFLGEKERINAATTLGDQVKALRNRPPQKAGPRYHIGLAACTLLFWMLLVGQNCWPTGYLYLVSYSFDRCEYLCETLNMSTSEANTDHGFRLTLEGNLSDGREDLVKTCRDRFGFRRKTPYLSEQWRRWSDPHWLIEPRGTWVIGQPLEGLHVHYNTSHMYGPADAVCHHLSRNRLVLFISVCLALLLVAICAPDGKEPLLTSGAVLLALLCVTGILTVWLGWLHCRQTTLHSADSVFAHSLNSCLSVVDFGATSFGKSMNRQGHLFVAYESKFRHAHQISRSEVWFGSLSEAVLLAVAIAAHVVFKHKRMQTTETRFQLLCRRPGLVAYLLENLDVLNSLPPRDRNVTASTLYRVFCDHEGEFPGLKGKMDQMMALDRSDTNADLSGTASSFWLAVLYSAVRALIPSLYRHLVPAPGHVSDLPQENSLWLANALLVVVMSFVIYQFVLFQVNDAARRYAQTMRVWLLFDSLWRFPSQSLLAGDARLEIVQVRTRRNGEVVEELGHRHALRGDFSGEPASSEGREEGHLVNVQKVNEVLPTWWAWREYLLVDYTDKRVRLELHLIVGFAVLLTTAGQIYVELQKDGFDGLKRLETNTTESWLHSHLLDTSTTESWLHRHLGPLFLQSAWDVTFLIFPLLSAIHCAATMNSLIEAQVQKVLHLEVLCDSACQAGSQPHGEQDGKDDDVGIGIRNIFRMARSELSKGGSAATLFNCCKISKRVFAVTGATMSVFGGSQVVEILGALGNLVDE